MKKLAFLVFVFLFYISLVSATADVTVFNGWVSYHDEIDYKGTLYIITAANTHLDDEEQGKVLIKKNDERYVIPFGECLVDILYEYCFENRSYSEEGIDIDDQGRLQPALKLKLIESTLTTTLAKEKTFSQTEFLVDETAEVTISLENKGDTDITNIRVEEVVPDNFKIVTSDYQAVNNKMVVELNLFPGSRWETTYTIKALSAQEASYNTKVTYDTVEETKEETFGEKTLKFKETHKVNPEKLEKTYDRLDKDSLKVVIENSDTVDIFVNQFLFTISDPSIVSGSKEVERRTTTTYDLLEPLEVKAGEEESVQLDFAFNRVGNYSVSYKAIVQVRDKTYEYNESYDIEVDLEKLDCYFDAPSLVNASSIVPVNVIIENGKGEAFYEISGSYEIANERGVYEVTNINREHSSIVDRPKVVIPFSLEETTYEFFHTATYRTIDNQYFTCTHIQEVTAQPAEQLIALEAHFKDEESTSNTTTTLVVTLTNIINDPINEEIEIYFSSTQASAQKEVVASLADTITFEVPVSLYEFIPDSSASITTNINIPTYSYADSVSSNITITNPYQGNISDIENKTVDYIEDIEDTGSTTTKKRQTLMDKLIYFIKNFFK